MEYTTPAEAASFANNGPANTSASTLTIIMCLPILNASLACFMPDGGCPVASTITSKSPYWIALNASSVKSTAPIWSSFQPTDLQVNLARAGSRSAILATSNPGVVVTWLKNIEPNFPAPIRQTLIRSQFFSFSCNSENRYILDFIYSAATLASWVFILIRQVSSSGSIGLKSRWAIHSSRL